MLNNNSADWQREGIVWVLHLCPFGALDPPPVLLLGCLNFLRADCVLGSKIHCFPMIYCFRFNREMLGKLL